MKILMIGPFPERPEKPIGGVEAVIATLAPALARRPEIEELHVLSFLPKDTELRDVRIGDKLRVWYQPGQRRLALPTRSFLDLLAARRVADRIRPDIVHGQGIGTSGYIATRISGHSVVTVHGLITVEARMRSKGSLSDWARVRLIDAQVGRVLCRARAVISTSAYDAASLNGAVRGIRALIPNPVLPEFFVPSHVEPVPGRLLFAGMLVRRKNVVGLLRAFSAVRRSVAEARLVIVGPAPDPAYADEVRQEVMSLGLAAHVDLRGHVDNTELIHEIQRASVLVLFSQEETSPTIIAQTLAVGRPVVASRVGGIPEMVADGQDGFVVEPSDEQALAGRLIELLSSPGRCTAMGAVAQEIARQRSDPFAVARRTLEVYQAVLA